MCDGVFSTTVRSTIAVPAVLTSVAALAKFVALPTGNGRRAAGGVVCVEAMRRGPVSGHVAAREAGGGAKGLICHSACPGTDVLAAVSIFVVRSPVAVIFVKSLADPLGTEALGAPAVVANRLAVQVVDGISTPLWAVDDSVDFGAVADAEAGSSFDFPECAAEASF